MKPATLGHALSVLKVTGDTRERDHVLDVVGDLMRTHPITNEPVAASMFADPRFLDLMIDYAEGDARIATEMGLAIRRTVDIITGVEDHQPDGHRWFLDLREVLTGHFEDQHFLLEPLIPLGRQISIYASGKTGKSLLMLEVVCSMATGTGIWGNKDHDPIHVLYADFEMTPQDLKERLETLGYDLDHPKFGILTAHLRYAQLQPFAPFDTREGGEQMEELVRETGAKLVVIDTLIRSVEGEENSADTIKSFYRFTGQRLKAMGVTLVRVDHAGKDAARGQRGTSAKRDDVDVVWWLTVNGEELTVTCEASRMAWLPQEFSLRRMDDKDTGSMRHELFAKTEGRYSEDLRWDIVNTRIWHDLWENWDDYADPEMSQRAARAAFTDNGKAANTGRFNKVLKYMRNHYGVEKPPTQPPPEGRESLRESLSGESLGESDAY